MVPAIPSPETPWGEEEAEQSYFTTGRMMQGQGPGQCQSWQKPLVLSSQDHEACLPQKPRRRAPWGALSTGLHGAGHTGGA